MIINPGIKMLPKNRNVSKMRFGPAEKIRAKWSFKLGGGNDSGAMSMSGQYPKAIADSIVRKGLSPTVSSRF